MKTAAVSAPIAAWIFLSSAASAQSAYEFNPVEPSVPVPQVRYESAFSDYQAHRAEPLREWRELNDEAQRLGGHAGHIGDKPAQPDSTRPAETAPAADAKSASAPRPAHGAHHR